MTDMPSRKELLGIVPAQAGAAKILIVDDDQRNLLALSHVLEPLAEVVTVSSGRDALRALLCDDFAVILLDVFMPDMDGYETASLIRQREQTARIPIIFLSAVNKETEHLMRGYAMGAVDYVFKPVDPLVLQSKAAVFVDLYSLRQEVEARNRAELALHEAKLQAEHDRLEVERELQAARLRQAAILRSLPVVLFEASYSEPDGLSRKIVAADREATAGDQSTSLASVGNPEWEEHIPEPDRAMIAKEYATKREGDQASVRYSWAFDPSSPRYFLEQAVCVAPGSWVGSITDVTTQSTLESQLLQAQKLDALGQLTGGVAHDFNNLLAAIMGGLEMLGRRVGGNEAAGQIIEQMREASKQGVSLVQSLLAFARKQPLIPTAVSPDELEATVLPLARHALGNSYNLEWRSDCCGCRFYADKAQLTMAVLNLVINARDAMPDGGRVEISITVDSLDKPTPALRLAIRDHGTGIPEELIAKVTEPFFTTKPLGKGTGLGLSAVVGFVDQSGGKLSISNHRDGGTCVEIILPTASPCGTSALGERAATQTPAEID
jgi:signal transduction histidine kinase